MSTHKWIDRICILSVIFTVALTIAFLNGKKWGIRSAAGGKAYESRLFDNKAVHTIDIVMEDWEGFIDSCTEEEYAACSLAVDQEVYNNVAIRAKGNTSMMQVEKYGNGRYSFKIEFDHYDKSKSYYGLDKLCLNNIIQDDTYVKDYICYQMMQYCDVAAPLCSFVFIKVNGKDFGLYLAVEGLEEAFLERNFGSGYGSLYKPDSTDLVGGMNQSDLLLKYTDDEHSSYQNIFSNTITEHTTDADRDRLIASLKKLNSGEDLENTVDIQSVISYFVVHNFVCNFDSYTGNMIHNYYLYEKAGKMSMVPWDYNLAFGGFQGAQSASGLVNYPVDTPVSGAGVDARPMLSWIFSKAEYTEQYHQKFASFLSGYFDSGIFAEEIERIRSLITPYVKKDPTKFCTEEEFEAGINTLKEFCLLRTKSIQMQLAEEKTTASDGQQNGESFVDASGLTISAMGGMEQGNGGQAAGGKSWMDSKEGVPAMARPDLSSDGIPEMPADFPGREEQGTEESQGTSQEKGVEGTTALPEGSSKPTQNGAEQKNLPDAGMPPGKTGENRGQMDHPQKGQKQKDTGEVELTETQEKRAWMLVCVSVFLLLAGLFIAFFY